MGVLVLVHRIHVATPRGVCEEDKEGMNTIRGDKVCYSPWWYLPQSDKKSAAQLDGASVSNLCSLSH